MKSPLLCLTEVEWREVGANWTEDSIWPRNQTCPDAGELRWCQTHYSQREEITLGDKRWLLFQTVQSLFNGIGSTPKELDTLALIEAEVLDIKADTSNVAFVGDSQWLCVRCLQSIAFADIPQRMPLLIPVNPYPYYPRSDPECASDRLFLYADGGQVVETQIYASDGTVPGPTHLIFSQLSILNECEIYNWPVK